MKKLIPGMIAAVVLVSCAGGETTSDSATAATSSAATDTVAAAAATARAIEANPAGADSILKASGYTVESFQQLMYDIAADSSKAAAFASARL